MQDDRLPGMFVLRSEGLGQTISRGHSRSRLLPSVSKEMVEGLRFDPGALQRDVMMILYDPEKGARSEPNGTSREGTAAIHAAA